MTTYKQVSQDEWAEYLCTLRVYQTEGKENGIDVMYSKMKEGAMCGVPIGIVYYHEDGSKTYEIIGE